MEPHRHDILEPHKREPGRQGTPFRILYVCSANLCRSVMAERLTRHALLHRSARHGSNFQVSSAGLRAEAGQCAHPYTAAAIARLGATVAGFVTRPLTVALLQDSDLVLTATTRHRDCAVEMLPSASRRIFTIREFTRIAEHVATKPAGAPSPGAPSPGAVAKARRMVETIATLRGQVSFVPPAADDIADPPHRVLAFRACARDIAGTVERLVDALVDERGGVMARFGRSPR